MASVRGRNWLRRIRVLLISTGIVSVATVLKVSVIPLASDLSSSYLPPLQSSLLTWFRPPFPCLIINCIIIAIAVTSRLHRSRHEASPAIPDPPERVGEVGGVAVGAAGGDVHKVFQDKRAVEEIGGCLTIDGGSSDGGDKAEVVEMDTSEIPPISGSPAMKLPVSSRFIHRKSLSVISEGGRARRARDCERHETIEATWKAITEGRAMAPTTLMRHLSTCDIWDDQERPISSLELDHPPTPPENESEAFNVRKDRRRLPPPSPVNLRKEPSLPPDELNRRVEAFIEKFNEEMRLQRMESMDQLKEMMGRGL